MPVRTRRTRRILATRRQNERLEHRNVIVTRFALPAQDCCLQLPFGSRYEYELFVAVNRSRGEVRVSGRLPRVAPGIAINGNTAARRTPAPSARS
jgi:hypothetical protein